MLHSPNSLVAGLTVLILVYAASAFASDSPEAIKLRIGPGDPISGKEKAQLCQGCHGVTGISVEDLIPNLAGQYAPYLEKQIQNFRVMERRHQIMNAMAMTMTEAEVFDITAYFASQKQMKGDGKGESQVARNLFLKGDLARNITPCVICHGENGKGQAPNVATFPVIGGQHKSYLRLQLQNWRSGERANSQDNVMNKITKSLTDAEIEALSDYLSGL